MGWARGGDPGDGDFEMGDTAMTPGAGLGVEMTLGCRETFETSLEGVNVGGGMAPKGSG
jgi:hypothetical protein